MDENNIPLCIKCRHYAYWDHDHTCVKDMKVLTMFPESCNAFKKVETERILKLRIASYLNIKHINGAN